MPDTINTRAASLYDSTSKVFYPYTDKTAYINPYSSDRAGGELITEYNQRNALNTLCKKTMDFREYAQQIEAQLNDKFGAVATTTLSPTADPMMDNTVKISAGLYSFVNETYADTENWKSVVYATGVQDANDFNIECDGSNLKVKTGKAMIAGYNIESMAEVLIPLSEVLTSQDLDDVRNRTQQNPDNPIVTKFVKLVLMYAENGAHDERLNPPVDGVYRSVAIVVNDELLSNDGNELLLGTITLSEQRETDCTINPVKTRILPLDVVAGAEGYDELINTSGMVDGSIYGLRKDIAHHITDITNKLWLDNGSNLAKLLKALSAQPETATLDDHKNTRAVITTVGLHDGQGNENSALRLQGGDYPCIDWYQAYALETDANATIERRAIYHQFGYCEDELINKELLPVPAGSAARHYTYSDTAYPELNDISGKCGIITPQQAFMIEKAYQATHLTGGTQYGPFMSVQEAARWFREHPSRTYAIGDYFWIINDTLKYSTTVSSDYDDGVAQLTLNGYVTTDPVTISGTIAGNVSGTVTGTVSGTSNVTGNITGEVTETHQAVTGQITEGTASIDATAVTGNVTGIANGTVAGTLSQFDMNVSARYSCVYGGPSPGVGNHGVKMIARGVNYVGGTLQPTDKYGDGVTVSDDGQAWFVLQAVERGYGINAGPNTYGLVKTGDSGNLKSVVKDASTNRLCITDGLYNMIINDHFTEFTEHGVTLEAISNTTMPDLTQYWNKQIVATSGNDSTTFTFKLKGKASVWEGVGDVYKTIKRMRPHIIIDYSEMEVDEAYQGGIIFKCVDIDYVTLVGDNRTSNSNGVHTPTAPLKLSFDHCIVDTPFFENIGYWNASSFTSGSNTIELNNPWMTVDKIFTKNEYINNKLYTRFSSVTMGETGISSAMMDMWIQYENTQPNSNSVDRCLSTIVRIDFPPLMYEFDTLNIGSVTTTTDVNSSTIQFIPSDICMKIGATAGVHEILQINNDDTQQYQVSGNLLATVDWSYNTHFDVNNTPDEPLYLNLYMKNSSGDPLQKISNLKFRVPVQVTHMKDNTDVKYADFFTIFQRDPHPIGDD